MNHEKISKNLLRLQEVEKTLQKEFVGLDQEITQICELIRPWFLLPESLNKPIVINLWGLTGVGKTTLIRRLVELLGVSANFAEFDLGKFAEVPKYPELFAEEFIDRTDEPNIFLFDEFQTIKTLSPNGEDPRTMMRDIWSLLSDGQINFNINLAQFRQNFITEILPQFNKEESTPRLSGYEAGRMYLFLKDICYSTFKEFFKDFSNNPKIIIDKVAEHLDKAPPRKTIKLTQSLIFISGNIDDLFEDVFFQKVEGFSADELHQSMRQITPLKIKQFLKRYFRPEQISRLGNNHLIFPSFKSDDYQMIIEKLTEKSISFFKEKTTKELKIDISVKKLIFKQGVQPIQGIRPLLSTYGQIVDSYLPEIILQSILSNNANVLLSFNPELGSLEISFLINQEIIKSRSINLSLIKDKKHSPELQELIIHHEAAHAIVGWSTSGKLPVVIRTQTPFADWGGQVLFPVPEMPTFNSLKNNLSTLLAGYVLEKKLFKDLSVGSATDLDNATLLASRMVRELGMGSHLGVSQPTLTQETLISFRRKDDQEIEHLLQEAAKTAWSALKKHKRLYFALVKELRIHVSLTPEQFLELIKKFDSNSLHLSSRRQYAHRAKDRRTN